jgi:hypothetical protein
MLIVEDNESARRLMRETISSLQARKFESLSGEDRIHFPFRKIKENPLFQAKRGSSVLQIADFCAYVFKRFLMNQDDKRYLRFFDPMRPYFSYLSVEQMEKLQRKAARQSEKVASGGP